MPIVKDLNNLELKFVCNPAVEMLASLHVLAKPLHHIQQAEWANSAVLALKKKLYQNIIAFGKTYAGWSFAMDIADCLTTDEPPELFDMNAFAQKVRVMPISHFAYIFLGETLIEERDIVGKLLKTRDFSNMGAFREAAKYIAMEDIIHVLSDPEGVRREFLSIIVPYWNSFFSHEWQAIRPFHLEQLALEKERLLKSGTTDYILGLHENLAYENDAIVMKKETRFIVRTENIDDIYIYFSSFTAPHLMINILDQKISVYKNIPLPAFTDFSDGTIAFVRAIGDKTRLKILKTLLEQPCTNKDLAKLFKLSPPTVTQHLGILKKCGLLEMKKDKNFIIYSANRELFQRALISLQSSLGL